MSTVTLSIGPQNYTIACADGQEAHIQALGAIVAAKYAQLGSARAPLEAQNILFAALFMADELTETKNRLETAAPEHLAELEHQVTQLRLVERAAQEEISRLKSDLAKSQAARKQDDLFIEAAGEGAANALAERLEQIATKAEAIASMLEADEQSA
jgi:cell division protein ZapA